MKTVVEYLEGEYQAEQNDGTVRKWAKEKLLELRKTADPKTKEHIDRIFDPTGKE